MKHEIEFRNQKISECECCGAMYFNSLYLNGQEYEEFGNIERFDEDVLKFVVDEVNEGIKSFSLMELEDLNGNDFLIINDKSFQSTYSTSLVEKLLDELQVEYNTYYVNLSEAVK